MDSLIYTYYKYNANHLIIFLQDEGFVCIHLELKSNICANIYRNDLANIVRRRGYKLIRELLANSTTSNNDGLDPKKSFDENQGAISDHEHILTGLSQFLLSVIQSSL